MSDTKQAVGFAVIVALVCCLCITAASTGLKARQQNNMRIDRQKNILKAASIAYDPSSASPADIEALFKAHIFQVWAGSDGKLHSAPAEGDEQRLPLYLTLDDGEIISYILPVDSRGLWGRIKGYMAIEADGSTIKGFTVYSHQETPGLGGEIESDWFQKNFVGKKIVGKSGEFAAIKIAKGKVLGDPENEVDGISGATLTGRYLSEGLATNLATYERVSLRFRQNLIKKHLDNLKSLE
ncbi:FMN-binding protein [Desulfoluna butyratoxydans]|uniref:Na(+)-translocating NADH-quinone reductase subunit C n=1 Tax=Desulfoluna butyratoxydans TaxID=231438 RepID=A0A4U8YPV5_9BACT|nr:FMN-binding protein [Desulfoluna butyratoxydans]VFQ45830.1 fmn-binding [Desulfoluna butyratoxydans]